MSILRSLKHLVRDRLPYSVLLPLYTWRHRWKYDSLYVRALRKAEFKPLEEYDLSHVKRSSVLFVLGSGASINRIGPERWAAIAAHDSVGFNFWMMHPFIPKMYFFESSSARHQQEHDRKHIEGLLKRSVDYQDSLKVVMDIAQPGPQYVFDLPLEFRKSVYAAGTVTLVARNRAELARSIRSLVERGEFERSDHVRQLVKITGTLSTLITLGVRMGYRTIVLCGVDLSSAEYFYQDPILYPETASFQYMPRTGKHRTMEKYAWGVMPIDEVVLELKRQVLDPAGINLYIESRSSALWPRIPLAPDHLFEEINRRSASADSKSEDEPTDVVHG